MQVEVVMVCPKCRLLLVCLSHAYLVIVGPEVEIQEVCDAGELFGDG